MEKLIVIVGLTSSGKSSLGISLAKKFNGEIVSADSRQVYKGLDFCSGKVSKEEMSEVPHHLIDVANLGEQFTLFDFQSQAYAAIDDILSRGKQPFLVGGTGLYSRAIVEGYSLSNAKVDDEMRKTLNDLSKDELVKICEEKNIAVPSECTSRRLVRLIENFDSAKTENSPRYEVLQIGIKWERAEIYERIGIRLKQRMPDMIEEIKSLLSQGASEEFLMSLGLEAKYVLKYLRGDFENYDQFFEELFKEERHFAKRQQTWYNKEKDIIWLDAKDNLQGKASQLIEKFLKTKK
jgi:tRNA dimethylallyltransferase